MYSLKNNVMEKLFNLIKTELRSRGKFIFMLLLSLMLLLYLNCVVKCRNKLFYGINKYITFLFIIKIVIKNKNKTIETNKTQL